MPAKENKKKESAKVEKKVDPKKKKKSVDTQDSTIHLNPKLKQATEKALVRFYPFIPAILVVAGLVCSYVCIQFGGVFVGIGCGIAFKKQLSSILFRFRELYKDYKIGTTIALVGILCYLFLSAPIFAISTLATVAALWWFAP